MFKKISNAAEKLATNVSESRRGFLVRVGQAALGVAGVCAGLFGLPTGAEAGRGRALTRNFCEIAFNGNGWVTTGYCVTQHPCNFRFSSSCNAGTYHRGGQRVCGTRVTTELYC